MINRRKINLAYKATDIIIDKAAEASDALRIMFTNGYGVLSDPSNVQGNLRTAKAAIDAALTVMKDAEWPNLADYGE